MSMFPDTRTDDYYNEDFLQQADAEFVRGFDWAIEFVLDNLFNNLDVAIQDEVVIRFMEKDLPKDMRGNTYTPIFRFLQGGEPEERTITTYADMIRANVLEYAEMERDELITSMIDNMDEDVYQAVRNKVLKDNEKSKKPKEYYNSRKYICTGKKEYRGPEEDAEE